MKKSFISKNSFLISFVSLLAISFFAINVGSALFLGSNKLDLTMEQKYTLSEETLDWLNNNKSPFFIKLYLSPNLDEQSPQLGQYSRYVMRFLEQYKLKGNHNLNLVVEEVVPYSLMETEAKKHNIRGFLDKSGQYNLYFGATFSNDQGQSFSIPFFEMARQTYLEHDVSRILSKLKGYEVKNIAVISPVMDIVEKSDAIDNTVDWPFIKQLRNDYDFTYLTPTTPQIPFGVDMLMVVNPQNLSDVGVYAIDQYLMRGGKIMIFADPFSEVLLNTKGYKSPHPSNLMRFYHNLGLSYDDNVMVGDKLQSQSTIIRTADGNSRLLDYPIWLELDAKHINQDVPFNKGLSKLRFNSAGAFKVNDVKSAKVSSLFTTSEQSGSMSTDVARYGSQANVLDAFKVDGKNYSLGLLLEGDFSSSFMQNIVAGSELEKSMLPFLITSIKSGKLMLVADSDFLFHSNWNQGTSYESSYDYVPYSNNIDFVEKAVDYLTENQELLSTSPKNDFNSKATVGGNLKKMVDKKYADRYDNYKHNMEIAQQENEILIKKIKNQELIPSIAVIKEMENLQRSKQINQEKLKKLEYKMQTKNQFFIKLIIIFNSFVFPAFLIVILALIVRRKQSANEKEALRYTK